MKHCHKKSTRDQDEEIEVIIKNKVSLLSIMGLIPFLSLSFGVWFIPFNLPYEALCLPFFLFSLMINSFLSGNLWSYNLDQRISPIVPIIFFFLPLAVFFVMTIITYNSLQLGPILGLSAVLAFISSFLGIYFYELKNKEHEPYYSRLRLRLTAVVVICHLSWAAFFIRIIT